MYFQSEHLWYNLGQFVHNTSAGKPPETFTDGHGNIRVFITFNSYKNVGNTHLAKLTGGTRAACRDDGQLPPFYALTLKLCCFHA